MTRVTKELSVWLFEALRGMYTSGVTLYVGALQAAQAALELPGDVNDVTLTLTGEILGGNETYPMCTKEEVKTPYITYDNIEVIYASTKDGAYPDSVSARVLCVHKTFTDAETLCDSVVARINGATIPALGRVKVTTRRADYDDGTREYLEELRITVEL